MRLTFEVHALEDLQYWTKNNARKALKILELVTDCLRNPYDGIGKPEPLKHQLAGAWSRRIDREQRLVYRIEDDALVILQARYHYS